MRGHGVSLYGRGLLMAALLGLLLAGCATLFAPVQETEGQETGQDDAWSPEVVRLAVCWPALPLAEDLRAAYVGYRNGITIEIAAMSSEQAHSLAASGQADLAIIAAPDQTTARARAPMLPWRHLARDGLAIIVHRDNALSQIGEQALSELYAGYITDWSALEAGQGAPEFAIQSAAVTARQVFDAAIMAGQDLSTAALVLPHDQAVLSYVAEHPLAIGYLSAAYLGREPRVKAVSLDGLWPSRAQLEVGGYPLSYELFISAAPEAPEEAYRFQEFALGRLGREMISERYGLPR